LRGLGEAADLADILERGRTDFFLGRRRLEVVQGTNVSTHAPSVVAGSSGRAARKRAKGADVDGALRVTTLAAIPWRATGEPEGLVPALVQRRCRGGTPLSGVSLRPSGRTPPGSRKNFQTS